MVLTDGMLQGLIAAEKKHGFEGEGYVYMKNPLWWFGLSLCKTSLDNMDWGHTDTKGHQWW